MAGKIPAPVAGGAISTGGSLISDAKLKQLYVSMMQCRMLVEQATKLRLPAASLFAASMGQEAIATGCTIDLRPEDTIVLARNDSIASLVKGAPLADLLGRPLPYAVSEQFHLTIAAASGHKRTKKGHVVVAFVGEAETRLPAWKKVLKSAVKHTLPIIFVVINNPWKITGPRKEEDFTQQARKSGLTGISVDANDVVAVYRVAHESLDRVRQGDGPVLVEGKTHRTSTDQKVSKARRDPLVHMERYLTAKKLFTERWKQKVVSDFSRQLDTACKATR